MSQKKVAISACLLGEYCRYDGATKISNGVIEAFKGWQIIPFCPEAPVLGTPRGRISVVRGNGDYRLKADEDGCDVTELIAAETRKLAEAHPDLDRIVLKSKSPSCGLGTTPILDETGDLIGYGNGIASQMLIEHFQTVEIVDENLFETKEKQ